jgi:LmbE family N-acetylglucosaminyl deacetylase
VGNRVLIVAAHPDDELLGVGGTLLRHLTAGDEVAVAVACGADLNNGEERIPVGRSIARDLGYSLAIGPATQLGYEVPDLPEIAADIVYTHHPGDLNRDHRLVAEAVQVACRPHTANVTSLRYFETPSSTEWGSGFVPNLFVDIDAHLAEKVHLVGRYETEMRPWPHPRSEQALIDRARYWGSVAGFRAAEAFMVGRERW